MKELRFGVIGCGMMGREFASAAARWLHLLDMPVRPSIAGACDLNPNLLSWFGTNFPNAFLTSNYQELLARPDIDAIYCAVPHNLHAQMYSDIIAAGKHLLGEKPFGIDKIANTKINASIAQNPNVLVRCSSEFPFYPGAQQIVQDFFAGRFGRIIEVEAGLLHSSDLNPNKPINWKRVIATNGEYGCMGDLGMHVLHLPLRFGWIPKDVRALLTNIFTTRPDATGNPVSCETWDNATLATTVQSQHKNFGNYTFPMLLHTKRIAPGHSNNWFLRIVGTEYSAEFSTSQAKRIRTLPYTPGGKQAWHEQEIGYEPVYPSITAAMLEFGFTNAVLQMWAAFCDEAVGNKPKFSCVTPEEVAFSHTLFTAALESERSGQTVALIP